MKKSGVLLSIVMVIVVLGLSSYESGPAHHEGLNCSGSESDFGNPVGCSTGNCHGNTATSGIVVTIEVDAAGGIPVTKYKGGMAYTVKLRGTNTTTNVDPYFGFQLTAITGAARVDTPVNAGTWQRTGLPAGVQYSVAIPHFHLANVVEHNTAISASSGTGGAGTVYSVSIGWTAPDSGTGTISFWAALNAVDGIDVATGFLDFWNTQSLVLEEDTSTTTAVNNALDNINVNIYPNPANDFIQLELENAISGLYHVNAYNGQGQEVSSGTLQASGSFAKTVINATNWPAGLYLIQLSNGSSQKVLKVVRR